MSDNKKQNKPYKDKGQGQSEKPKKAQVKIPKNKIKKVKIFVLKKFKLSVSIGGYKAGSVIRISCHKQTLIPKDRYWRKRLRDAKVDNCMVPYIEETLNKDNEL